MTCSTRRSVLAAALGIPAAALTVSGCSSDDKTTETPKGDGSSTSTSPSSSGSASSPAGDAAGVTVKIADVPEGGGLIVPNGKQQIAVSQPSKGTFKAFSAACTHQGVIVAAKDDTFACPAHGSVFALDGTVKNGPAESSLKELKVTKSGDSLTIA